MPAARKGPPPPLAAVPFTRSEARSFGVSDEILHGPSVQLLGHGLYLASGPEPTRRQLLAGFLKLLPDGCTAVDGVTALQWWGVDVGTPLPYRFVTTASYRSQRQTLRV
jgi:hypothetical protein